MDIKCGQTSSQAVEGVAVSIPDCDSLVIADSADTATAIVVCLEKDFCGDTKEFCVPHSLHCGAVVGEWKVVRLGLSEVNNQPICLVNLRREIFVPAPKC